MRKRTLGRSGLAVSEIGCGTYRSFDQPGEAGRVNVLRLVHANIDQEINFFDTAPMYGNAEHNLGRALEHESVAPLRENLIIATKVLERNLEDAKSSVRTSERLLGRIDLMQVHNMAAWKEVLPWLAKERERGRFNAVGITHYAPRHFDDMIEAMKTGLVDTIQIPYNPAQREAEHEIVPAARDMNVGIIIMTPMTPLMAENILPRLAGIIDPDTAARIGISDPGALALRYVLSKGRDFVPIPATSKTKRVGGNAAAGGLSLPDDVIERIDSLFSR